MGGGEVAKQLNTYFNSDNVLGFNWGIFSNSPVSFNKTENIYLGV